MPSDEPTENTAETTSKSIARIGSVGSNKSKIIENSSVLIIERVTTALARLTDGVAIFLLKAVMPCFCSIIERRLRNITPIVLTFTPPAIDCDDPPIHICTNMSRRVTFVNSAGLTVA
jgi:hypothetical protein